VKKKQNKAVQTFMDQVRAERTVGLSSEELEARERATRWHEMEALRTRALEQTRVPVDRRPQEEDGLHEILTGLPESVMRLAQQMGYNDQAESAEPVEIPILKFGKRRINLKDVA
jgi:hypothetical protein